MTRVWTMIVNSNNWLIPENENKGPIHLWIKKKLDNVSKNEINLDYMYVVLSKDFASALHEIGCSIRTPSDPHTWPQSLELLGIWGSRHPLSRFYPTSCYNLDPHLNILTRQFISLEQIPTPLNSTKTKSYWYKT
jgi:hypothetical protein